MKLIIKKASLIKKKTENLEICDILFTMGKSKKLGRTFLLQKLLSLMQAAKYLFQVWWTFMSILGNLVRSIKEDLIQAHWLLQPADYYRNSRTQHDSSIDTPTRLRNLLKIASKKSIVNFLFKGCDNQGMMGRRLTDIPKLKKAGAKAISDDGNPIPSYRLMRNALIRGEKSEFLLVPMMRNQHSIEKKCSGNKKNMESSRSILRCHILHPERALLLPRQGLLSVTLNWRKEQERTSISHM